MTALVVIIALLAIGWNIQNAGIATGYIDSVRKLGAQDEAVYTREAIYMATAGHWLTQTFLDRFVLFKPPLLMWLSGFSIKLFGVSSLPVRLPAILCGALVALLAFRMSPRAPWAAVILLLSDRLFHTLARVNMTDIVLAASLMIAFYSFSRDTRIERPLAFWGFGIGVGLAILAKSIAGLLPFVVIGLFWLAARREDRPRIARVIQSGLVALAIILPWHLYQAIAHTQWFLAEYLGVQLLAFGGKPPQTSQENQVLFYLSRLAYSDPELGLLALFALPGLILALRKRTDTLALLLAAWIAVFGGALLIFQYRSVQYMLPLIPALAILAAVYIPALQNRVTMALLIAVFAVKAAYPNATWGLSYASGNTLPTAKALHDYCDLRRPTDLIVLEPDDEFYSSVLPLTHVRYGWMDPNESMAKLEPHLRWLGIMLSVDEFVRVDQDTPLYRSRLASWGLRDPKPIGTAVFAHNAEEMRRAVASRPHSDFLLPAQFIPPDVFATHDVRFASEQRVFLIAKEPTGEPFAGRRWSCGL